jgi:uncharacterized membrane protein YjfL (UPF0719 family)
MSDDEMAVLMVSGIISAVGWGAWYTSAAMVTSIGSSRGERLPVYFAPLACAGLLFTVLSVWASHDVRDNFFYILMYLAMGMAWVVIVIKALPLLGLNARDDAIERRNTAAAWAVAGALVGFTAAFAGGNIGDGPHWIVVFFSAALSTLGLLFAWAVIATFTPIVEAISLDRDLASGLRLAGFLTASGAILGRAVAGDWVSVSATFVDFVHYAWPVLILIAVELFMSRLFRPTPQHPSWPAIPYGAIPAMVYVAIAALFLTGAGWW